MGHALLNLGAGLFRQLAPHQDLGHVPSRRDQDEAGKTRTVSGLYNLACKQKRQPAAHGRADDDGGLGRHERQHALRLMEPIADGGLEQRPARKPMARIVEAEHGKSSRACPVRQDASFGAGHIGEETWEPKELNPGRGPVRRQAIGDPARFAPFAHLQELRFGSVHPKKRYLIRAQQSVA